MRNVLILFLLLPVFAASQDCKLIRETDPFTKLTKVSTGFIALDGGSVTIDTDGKEIDVLFSVEGTDKCYDNNSTAYVFFENVKAKSSARNNGSMNCEGLFHFIYRNSHTTQSLLQKLTTQKVTHIIFTGNNKKETTVSLQPAEQKMLMDLAACLVAEAKTMIK